MTGNHVDLRSDTVTRPTAAMRQAMAEAEVGDEQRGEDPTTNALCARVAALLGKEAAVFLPSGSMCNEIALLVHCRPGDEIICDRTAHIVTAEGGGPAALAGAMVRALDGEAGVYTPEQLAGAVRAVNRYAPRSRLAVVEQTSNQGGGTIWPIETIEAVGETAKAHGLSLHMDGARLLNAVVETGVDAARYAAPCDSVWVDFSKGLGCPVGAVLAGSADSSRPRGNGSSASAVPCASRASSPPPPSTPSTTMSRASPRITPRRGPSPMPCARCPGSPSTSRVSTATWSSSTAPGRAQRRSTLRRAQGQGRADRRHGPASPARGDAPGCRRRGSGHGRRGAGGGGRRVGGTPEPQQRARRRVCGLIGNDNRLLGRIGCPSVASNTRLLRLKLCGRLLSHTTCETNHRVAVLK